MTDATSTTGTPATGTNGTSASTAPDPSKEISTYKRQAWEAEERAKALEQKYKGIDPDEHFALKEANKAFQIKDAGGDPKKIEEIEKRLDADYAKKYGGQISEKEEKIKAYEGELNQYRVLSPMREKFPNLNEGAWEDLKPHVEKACRYINGEIVIVDDKGQPRRSEANPQNPMTVDEYVTMINKTKAYLFKSTAVKGHMPQGEKTNGNGTNGEPSDITKAREVLKNASTILAGRTN